MKHGLLLLSGGFDSAVAGWMMRQRGLRIAAVHFSSEPFTDDAPERKSRALAEQLGFSPFRAVRTGPQFAQLAERCNHRLYYVLSKRLMMRLASRIAAELGCDSLVTGESLGQVSSQTLDNLMVIDRASALPVLRPLLGMDKEDIIRRAVEIGSYELSKGPEMCSVLGPRNPATRVREEQVLREEQRVDIAAMVRALS